jgi:hypothetical protein
MSIFSLLQEIGDRRCVREFESADDVDGRAVALDQARAFDVQPIVLRDDPGSSDTGVVERRRAQLRTGDNTEGSIGFEGRFWPNKIGHF